MKKFLFIAPVFVLLLALSFGAVSAAVDYEDPKLCVDGQWLLVDAALPSSTAVTLPEGVRYGDQKAGGCKTSGPNVPLIKNVDQRGHGENMMIKVQGANATNPVVVTYDGEKQTKKNNGKATLSFVFKLD
jgi:hypothetical protein